MNTLSTKCEQLTGIYERTIREDVNSWGNELFLVFEKISRE